MCPYLNEEDFNAPNGELNRAFTKLLLKDLSISSLQEQLLGIVNKYINNQKPRYSTFNDVIGALECAKLEYKRRRPPTKEDMSYWDIKLAVGKVKHHFYNEIVSPYEDKKIAEHGDIYK